MPVMTECKAPGNNNSRTYVFPNIAASLLYEINGYSVGQGKLTL